MVDKIHGFTSTGYEALTGNLDFFTVRTLVPVLTNGQDVSADFPGAPVSAVLVGDATTQGHLDVMVETISLRAQPVIMSLVEVTRETVISVTDLPGVENEGDSHATVYTLKFAIEHTQAWDADLLGEALDAAAGPFVYRIPSGSPGNNVSVVIKNTL
jgi:hypothetical protein